MATATTTASVKCSSNASSRVRSSWLAQRPYGRQCSLSPSFLAVPNKDRGQKRLCVKAVLAMDSDRKLSSLSVLKAPSALFQDVEEEEEEEGKESIDVEKIDDWMKGSISEIVRNIDEAPFLVHLFSGNNAKNGIRLQREQASPDGWPQIKKRWEKDGQPRPDGIILVEEIKEKRSEEDNMKTNESVAAIEQSGNEASKMWGLVVQGRGMDCVACYVLNTCRVRSSAGFCTHFGLARAQCFGDPLELQLRNAWLQQRLSR